MRTTVSTAPLWQSGTFSTCVPRVSPTTQDCCSTCHHLTQKCSSLPPLALLGLFATAHNTQTWSASAQLTQACGYSSLLDPMRSSKEIRSPALQCASIFHLHLRPTQSTRRLLWPCTLLFCYTTHRDMDKRNSPSDNANYNNMYNLR